MADTITPTCIQTFSGRIWDIADPKVEDVVVDDIVAPLLRIVRFNGHSMSAVSVAEHSLLVAALVGVRAKPYALLHDAHEAYIGDIATPVARALASPTIGTLKHKHDTAIFEAFGLGEPGVAIREEVEEADRIALSFERAAMMCHQDAKWPGLVNVPKGVNPGMFAGDFRAEIDRWCPKVPTA